MPCGDQAHSFVGGDTQAPLVKEGVERDPVELIEVGPAPRARVHLGQDRAVPGAPGVGELVGIVREPADAKRLRDAGSPVDERPEHVEDEGLHRHRASLLGYRPPKTCHAVPRHARLCTRIDSRPRALVRGSRCESGAVAPL
jgi:hypothetical protein